MSASASASVCLRLCVGEELEELLWRFSPACKSENLMKGRELEAPGLCRVLLKGRGVKEGEGEDITSMQRIGETAAVNSK